jgi:hypothetical protein
LVERQPGFKLLLTLLSLHFYHFLIKCLGRNSNAQCFSRLIDHHLINQTIENLLPNLGQSFGRLRFDQTTVDFRLLKLFDAFLKIDLVNGFTVHLGDDRLYNRRFSGLN